MASLFDLETKEKKCRRCKAVQPIEGFRRTKTGWLWNICRKCETERAKQYNRTPAGKAAIVRYQKSEKCKEYLKGYLQTTGKEVGRKYRASAKGKASRARCWHRRRLKLRQVVSTLTAQEWEEIKAMHKGKCFYCKRKVKDLTMDHVIPLSKGGDHVKENVVPSCRKCNSSKGNKILTLF